MARPVSEAEICQREEERIRSFIAELRAAIELETSADQIDRERWGNFSADWNTRVRAWWYGIRERCHVRSRRHRAVHTAAAQLFPAWQAVHYALTRGRALDMAKLDAVEEMVKEAGQTERSG
ncbi:MAG: hypothetical protein JXC32_19345 [Anaerolineae bacterium]|nr:hypothetical protein [Anaerolineae bacterium]